MSPMIWRLLGVSAGSTSQLQASWPKSANALRTTPDVSHPIRTFMLLIPFVIKILDKKNQLKKTETVL
tara:strand:- start:320 stop:523 length:204 start_codon:yes stop_codon:yes gene_type:complete